MARKGEHLSEETKRKLSESLKGNGLGKKRPETSKSLLGNKRRLGVRHTEESKLKMRAAHATPEYIKNQSEKHKGKKLVMSDARKRQLTEQARLLGYKNKGHRHSPEAKAKMTKTRIEKGTFAGSRNPRYGKHPTESTRRKMSLAHIGLLAKENHPNWKGGITALQDKIRNSFKYRQWRSDVFTRDNYTCQGCRKRGGDLEAHHTPKMLSEILAEYDIKTIKEAMTCEELWNINNGQTLCIPCHNKTKKRVSIRQQLAS